MRVTVTVSACAPVAGEIEAKYGPTVNTTALLVPLGVVTVMLLGPTVAEVAIVKFAVTVASFTTAMLLTVTPEPPTLITAPVRWLPVRVIGTTSAVPLVLNNPETGLIVASDGAVADTVKFTGLLVPLGVVTVTA